jgi:GAF domain-containing protein
VPVPAGETARLAALQRYQILDTSPAQAFGQIVQSAADTGNVPVALISLVDRHRQWFLAAAGLAKMGITVQETPREIAFCAHTIMGDGLLVVEDATRDDRFRYNPLVTGPVGIRFYAGMPLLTREGHTRAGGPGKRPGGRAPAGEPQPDGRAARLPAHDPRIERAPAVAH